jgi:parallel beta-helix repeat protein
MSDIIVATRSELLSALSSAKGGETIILKNGSYGNITATKDYASYVTIEAQNPLDARFTGLTVSNGSYLRFDGIDIDSGKNGGKGGNVVLIADNSHHVEILNSEVSGKKDNVFTGHNGIEVSKSNHITLRDNDVHDVDNGIVVRGASTVEVSDNIIDYVGNDVMKFGSVRNAVIEDNVSFGHLYPPSGAHNDFVQFQGASSNILLHGNVYLANTEAAVQGIFLAGATYNDITIEQNIIYTGLIRGITVSKGSDIVVRNNTLLDIPKEIHKGTNIDVPGGSSVSNNIITAYAGGKQGSNLKIQNLKPAADYYVDDYFVNGSEGRGVTISDLRPVSGSLAETLGAAARLAELLGGKSPSSGGSAPASRPPASEADPEPAPAPKSSGDPDALYSLSSKTFNGSKSSIISLSHSKAFEVSEGSVTFRFKADDVSGWKGLVSKDAAGLAGGGHHFSAYLRENSLEVRFQDGSGQATLKAGGIKAKQTYEVLATFDKDEIRFYLDDKLVGSRDFTMDWTQNKQALQIGGLGWASESGALNAYNPFDGVMSDVFIFDEALLPADVDLMI